MIAYVKQLPLKHKLLLLIGMFSTAMVVFGATSYSTLAVVQVHGPQYDRIVIYKDLAADIAPPPEFIVEAYLLTHLMPDMKGEEQLKLKAKFADLKKEYFARQDYWRELLPQGELRSEILDASRKPVEQFFNTVETEFYTALAKDDGEACGDIVRNKLNPLFEQHKAVIYDAVGKANKTTHEIETDVEQFVAFRTWFTVVVGGGLLLVAGCFAYWLRGLLIQQEEVDVENAAKLAAIDRSQAVIEFTPDGVVTKANENFLSAMGYSQAEVLGQHHRMFVEETYRNSHEYREFWARLGRGECFAAEYTRYGKGGKRVVINASYNPIRDNAGKITKVVKYANDVTETIVAREASQKQIQEAAELDRKKAEEMAHILDQVNHNATTLGSAAEELTAISSQMATNADETSAQANVVSAASEQVSKNVQTVATGVEEMNSAIREIAKNASDSARVSQEAVSTAATANATISKLGDSSAEIGKVIKVITSIAEQTNLLALNATIEAARAGEAGKGFAVVANEVKELAKETAKATEDISQKIEAIQGDSQGAIESIRKIGEVIAQINDISNTIASAVEEQTATANEMSRNVAEAAKGTCEIAQNITSVAQAAQSTTQGATNCQQAAAELARMATELQSLGAGESSTAPEPMVNKSRNVSGKGTAKAARSAYGGFAATKA